MASNNNNKKSRNSFFPRSHSVHYCTMCNIQCTCSAITRTAGKEAFILWITIFPASSSSQRQHNNKLEAPLSVKHCSSLLHEKQIVLYRGRVAHGAMGVGGRDLPFSLTISQTQKPLIDLSPPPHTTVSSKSFHLQVRWGEIPCLVEWDAGLETHICNEIPEAYIHRFLFNHSSVSLFNVWENWSISEIFFSCS